MNYSQEKHSEGHLHSPSSKKYGSQLLIQENPSTYTIEKPRALSHKKLSITSPTNQERLMERPPIRFTQAPTFEANKFYKVNSKPSLLLESKKGMNAEAAKISLKTSNYGFSVKQIQPKTSFDFLDILKRELAQKLRKYMSKAEKQRESQQAQINKLNIKIQEMSTQLNKKQNKIRELSKCISLNSPSKNPTNNDVIPQILHKKIADLSSIIRLSTQACLQQQKKLDQNLSKINCRFLHYIVLRKEVGDKLQQLEERLNTYQKANDNKIKSLLGKVEEIGNIKNNNKLDRLHYSIGLLRGEVEKIEDNFICTKSTISGIQNWESFEDYCQSNEPGNTSTYSYGGDVFFYPTFGKEQRIEKQEKNGKDQKNGKNLEKDSFCGNTTATFSKQSSVFSESSTFRLESLVKLLVQEYQNQLPLQCSIDKFSRIVPTKINKPLRNEEQECYYKVSEKQVQFLTRGQYIKLIPSQRTVSNLYKY